MRYLLVLAAACGSSSGKKAADAPVDNLVIDEAIIDSPPIATGMHYHYVVDHENVPTNNNQARMYGLDLNGDGTVDNQLGMVLATLSGMGFDVQTLADTDVSNGTILMLADLQTTNFTATTTDAGFTLYLGTNPQPTPCSSPQDTVCRHHLQGTGTFDVAASPRDPALVGTFASGSLAAGPGHIPLQIAFGSNPAITLDLIGARTKITATTTNITAGIVAGGVTMSDLNTKVYPAMQLEMMAIVQRDCCGGTTTPPCPAPGNNPACMCAQGSTGATVLGLFDGDYSGDPGPKDCAVSVDEIKMNSLIQSLFAPDVMLEGQQCISLGVGITAVPGTFTP